MSGVFTAEIAGIVVEVHHEYSYMRTLCADYLSDKAPDFSVSTNEADMAKERLMAEDPNVSDAYVEATCLHRRIADRLHEYDAFLLHSAVIAHSGEGYAFAAHSGVGKSTHIGLWQKRFGDKVCVVNGDKPVVRLVNGEFFAYGTPFRGKEGLGANISCPLRKLCFLERGEENRIERVGSDVVLSRIFGQVYLPPSALGATKTLDLLDRFTRQTDFYLLHCNMDISAADVSYGGMQ